MSQFPTYSIVRLTTEPDNGQYFDDVACLPQIWTRLAELERQVFGVAQQPPYTVPPNTPVEGVVVV